MKYAQRLRGRLHSVKKQLRVCEERSDLDAGGLEKSGARCGFQQCLAVCGVPIEVSCGLRVREYCEVSRGFGNAYKGRLGGVVRLGDAQLLEKRVRVCARTRLGGRGRSGARGGRDVCR